MSGKYVNPEKPENDISGAFSYLKNIADGAIANANGALNSASARITTPSLIGDLSLVDISTSFVKPTPPSAPSFTGSDEAAPGDLSLNYPTLDVDGIDTSGNPTLVALNLPGVPSPFSGTAPAKPTLNLDKTYPTAPTSTLGSLPTLITLTDIDVPSITVPVFERAFPTSNAQVPEVNYNATNKTFLEYINLLNVQSADNLLQGVIDRLLDNLDIDPSDGSLGSGFNPTVETAIYNRARAREAAENQKSLDQITAREAANGWSRPPGSALAALKEVIQNNQLRNAQLSREIMIKQAELEQENMKFSIANVINLEQILLTQYRDFDRMAFEQAKYVQDLLIEIYKLQLAEFDSAVAAYQAYAVAFRSRIEGLLAEVEIYKAQIEGEKAKAQSNLALIQAYNALASAIKTEAEIYAIEVEAINKQLEGEATKIQAYKAEVDGYIGTIQAKAQEYVGYSEQTKGELAKAQAYESQVRGYASLIEARAKDADVKIAANNSKVEIEKLRIQNFISRLDAYIKRAQANQLAYSNLVDLYKTQAEVYKSDVLGEVSRTDVEIKKLEDNIIQNKNLSDTALANARLISDNIHADNNLRIEIQKAIATIEAGIGTSALAAINVGQSSNISSSYDLNENHNFDHAGDDE